MCFIKKTWFDLMSQQADLSWRRNSSCSRGVSCQLKVNVHPSVGRDPSWLTKPLAKVTEFAWVCRCMCVLVLLRGKWIITAVQVFHSGRPAVGGGNLHACGESNNHRNILLLKITLGTDKKSYCFNLANVWWTSMCGRLSRPTPQVYMDCQLNINTRKHKNLKILL